MSQDQIPTDWRARAFLAQYPNAKLDGFETVSVQSPEPEEKKPTPESGMISSATLSVLIEIGGNIHQFALSNLQRATVLALIVKMHEGQPRLHAEPVEALTVEMLAQPMQPEVKAP